MDNYQINSGTTCLSELDSLNRADINLSALEHNFRLIHNLFPQKKIWAVIKANAYGHGSLEVAKCLQSISVPAKDSLAGFAVANIQEALYLRSKNFSNPVVCLSGFHSSAEALLMQQNNIISVLHDISQIDILEKINFDGGSLQFWLKLDSGMHRLGFTEKQIESVYSRLKKLNNLSWNGMKLMSHLACAEDGGSELTAIQLQKTKLLADKLCCPFTVANSAALWQVEDKDLLGESIRPGLALYGVSPIAGRSAKDIGLQAVMTLSSPIIAIKQISKGDTVGYGATFAAPANMKIAHVAIGYADGYPRECASPLHVLVSGNLCPVIGRVSMDMLAIDVSACEKIAFSDRAILWGDDLPVEDIAEKVGTIAYTLLTRVGARVQRIFKNKK